MVRSTSRMMKTAAVSAAALLALTACNGGGEEDTASGEVITVGIAGEVPYSYLDDNGEPAGATVALAERIFGDMGYEVEAELVDWDNLIPGLNAERFHAISAGMSITPERCAEAAFAEPEIMYTTALVVEEGNPHGVENLDDVLEAQESGEDITLATLTAGIEAGYATDLGLDYEGVGSADEGLEMVQGGRADVFAMTAISLNQMTENADGVEVTDPFVQEIDGVLQYGAGSTVFRKDDTETLNEYNEHLAELKSNGELGEILAEHGFTDAEVPPEDMTAEALCAGDLEALQDIEE
ncbi:transporter substrate-binding domain-containing protein [Enteractinococcus coprophilus]|uniref:Amino acid ABC transporter substrate-binding protein (PAAT family) n=1 Tax=Enteractinococcus coprophilus TaxID=1027633 RepID=A0A542ZZ25_9MICC|nr:transporter substrate-binding domain-containing protein [Enteractinococcus coprophilus]TQL65470.1 amino acid ABC transporter substrate-binding protein (PAAT family) [Enteractinococcus coprophilus]